MHVLILAGGFATRLWPLTEKMAKPLIPVAGKPLICFMVEKIPAEYPITISTNQVFANDFYKWKDTYFPKRNIEIFVEDSVGEQKKKGALAGVSLFLESHPLTCPLVLLAGDNYFGFDMAHFLSQAQDNPLLAAYDIKSIEEAKKFGVVVPASNTSVQAFEEKPEFPSSTLVSTGAYVFPANCLAHITLYAKTHADDLGGIFEYFLQNAISVDYYRFSEDWYDIGSFPAFMEANFHLLSSSCIDPSVSLDTNVQIEGKCVIEKDCILENVQISNSVILHSCVLKNVVLKDCLVCEQSILENVDFYNKMVRAGTITLRSAGI